MNRWTVVLAACLIILAVGCSGGSGNPVTPGAELGLSGQTGYEGPINQTQIWGYWDVHMNLETQTVETVLNRTAMFAATVVTFLNSNGGLAFIINDTPVDPDGAFIDVDIDVSLTHPLPGLPMYDGYDVRGVFISQGSANLA
jgi:hypothetical protein